MNQQLRRDAEKAIYTAINAVLPEKAVARALTGKSFRGRVFLIAIGKAACRMAEAALDVLPVPVADGVVISKYGHLGEPLPGLRFFEAGHPVPDENSVLAAEAALRLTEDLTDSDTVLFLLSGGGSALFEKPLISLEELQDITKQLLACGADIVEINTIRKRLSAVKGGKFAAHCAPAHIEAVILSDVLGDPLDAIASGPVSPDSASCGDALRIAEKYALNLSETAKRCLREETPKSLSNVSARIVGSVRELARAAAEACRSMGYEPMMLTDIPDIGSYNLYFGWYLGELTQNDRFFDEYHAKFPQRVIGFSEYGADANPQFHASVPERGDYTEVYQCVYHEHILKLIDKRPYLWATHVWNLFDFAADGRDEGGKKGENQKGLVLFDHKTKKDAFYLYKAAWSREPFVHLCGKCYSDRAEEETEIKVYSNCETVALFVDGKLFEEKTGARVFTFRVPIRNIHEIKAVSGEQRDSMTIRRVAEPESPDCRDPREDDAEHGCQARRRGEGSQ